MFGRFKSMGGYVFRRGRLLRNMIVIPLLDLTNAGLNLLFSYMGGVTLGMAASGDQTRTILGKNVTLDVAIMATYGVYTIRSFVVTFRKFQIAATSTEAITDMLSDYSDRAVHQSLEEELKPGGHGNNLNKAFMGLSSFIQGFDIPAAAISAGTTAWYLFSQQNPKYGAIFVGGTLITGLYNFKKAKMIIENTRASHAAGGNAWGELMNTANHSAHIQQFGQEEKEKKASRDAQNTAGKVELKSNKFILQVGGTQDCFLNGLLLVSMMTAGRDIRNEQLNGGDFATIHFLMIQGFLLSSSIVQQISGLVKSSQDFKPADEFINKPLEIVDDSKVELRIDNACIQIQNISFSYKARKDRRILKNISCDIFQGQKVAFVGETGSGKSTILRLIFRSIDPTEGSVLIAGTDIRKVSLKSLRSQIGVIPQDPYLKPGTLLENILYGVIAPAGSPKRKAIDNILKAAREDLEDIAKKEKEKSEKEKSQNKEQEKLEQQADSKDSVQLEIAPAVKMRIDSFPEDSLEHALIKEVLTAIDNAKLTDFVKEYGLLASIHEGGSNLSGGQRQRVAIARVLMRGENLKILLLDEATSALDAKTEVEVQAIIDDICKKLGCTAIWVTHHEKNVHNADCVFVLDKTGCIVQRGTHQELMKDPDGIYAKLCESQKPELDEKRHAQESRAVSFGNQCNHDSRLFPYPAYTIDIDEPAVIVFHADFQKKS